MGNVKVGKECAKKPAKGDNRRMKNAQKGAVPWPRTLLSMLLSALILLLLALYPLATMSAAGFTLVVLLLGYLIYWHLADLVLLRRRALLGYVTVPQSRWRQRLWNSVWVQVLTAMGSFSLALGALSAAAHLSVMEWSVLATSLASFSALQRLLAPFVLRHIEPAHQAQLLLRLAHAINLALLVVALLAIHFWFTEVPDTRHLYAADVATQAYLNASQSAEVALIGWLLGVNSALYALSWHAIQLVAAGAPWWVAVFVWALIAGALALQVSLIWFALLGAHAWIGRYYQGADTSATGGHGGARTRTLWWREHGAWVLLAAVALLFWWGIEYSAQKATLTSAENTRAAPLEQQVPCTQADYAQAEQQVISATENTRLSQQKAVIEQLQRDIAQVVDNAYEPAEQVVDAFLNWNFSLAGQYTQLAYLAKAGFSQEQFNALMAARLNEISAPLLGPAVSNAQQRLDRLFTQRLEQGLAQYYQSLRLVIGSQQTMPNEACFRWQPEPVELPDLLRKSGVGAGFAPGALLMSRALMPGGALVARSGGRRVFAALFTRFAARAGTSGSAATVGSVCGPGCSLLAGALVWLGTDLVINYGDERLNRAAMKEDLLAALYEQRDALKRQLQDDASGQVTQVFVAAQRRQLEQFNLSRELQPPPEASAHLR